MGLTEARQLLVPSLVLGWVWRFWVFLATVFAACALLSNPLFRSFARRYPHAIVARAE